MLVSWVQDYGTVAGAGASASAWRSCPSYCATTCISFCLPNHCGSSRCCRCGCCQPQQVLLRRTHKKMLMMVKHRSHGSMLLVLSCTKANTAVASADPAAATPSWLPRCVWTHLSPCSSSSSCPCCVPPATWFLPFELPVPILHRRFGLSS